MGKNNEEEVLWSLKKKDSGKVYSKIPYSRLKAWILEARIDPDDQLTNPQLRRWVLAASVKQLAPYFSPETMGAEVISSENMGFAWSDKEEDDIPLDMTPMIDVTFLLLIFFMVSTTYSMHQIKKISVPDSVSSVTSKPEKITVYMSRDKKITVVTDEGEETVSLNSLDSYVEKEVMRTRQQDILVAGDKSLEYQFIIQVLDKITKAGIKNINLKLNKKH